MVIGLIIGSEALAARTGETTREGISDKQNRDASELLDSLANCWHELRRKDEQRLVPEIGE